MIEPEFLQLLVRLAYEALFLELRAAEVHCARGCDQLSSQREIMMCRPLGDARLGTNRP